MGSGRFTHIQAPMISTHVPTQVLAHMSQHHTIITYVHHPCPSTKPTPCPTPWPTAALRKPSPPQPSSMPTATSIFVSPIGSYAHSSQDLCPVSVSGIPRWQDSRHREDHRSSPSAMCQVPEPIPTVGWCFSTLHLAWDTWLGGSFQNNPCCMSRTASENWVKVGTLPSRCFIGTGNQGDRHRLAACPVFGPRVVARKWRGNEVIRHALISRV